MTTSGGHLLDGDESTRVASNKTPHPIDPDNDYTRMIDDARKATAKEHNMTLRQVMEGYDVCLINNFYGFPQFNRKYGQQLPDGSYQIPARWQAGLSNGANVGELIGLVLNGFVAERIGYRWTIITCLVCLAGFIAIFFTAQSVEMLLVAEILCGIPWGVFQTITITYASEVCPVALRGYLTTYVNFCWGLGQFIGIGVIMAMLRRTDDWAFRIPYALQWMWPLPLAVGIFLAPESPWWLVRRGRVAEAKKALARLMSRPEKKDTSGKSTRHTQQEKTVGSSAQQQTLLTGESDDTGADANETIAMMQHTTRLEAQTTAGATYLDCFKRVDLRRTEIVCMVWAMQNLSGNSFSNYSTYFLQRAGLPTHTAYAFALGQYGINMVGVFGAWFLMTLGVGRRSLYLYGLCSLCVMLMVLGLLGLASGGPHERAASLATGAIMLCWALCYQLTVGTVCYSLVGELPSRRLQVKTIALGRILYIIVGIAAAVLTPYMLNPGAWNWRNYAGFFWGGICFLCVVYTYFRVPEPTGRTFAELDCLFEQKVPARKFAKTEVDVFAEETVRIGGSEKTTSRFV